MGDVNWSHNVDVSRADDGSLVYRKHVPGSFRRHFDDTMPTDPPFDEQRWEDMKRQWGAQGDDGMGPYRPEHPPRY
jgi:hypothetical protein